MKKILIVLSVILVLGLICGCESTYTRKVIVLENNNGIVTTVDNRGYIWEYKGSATIGDRVTLVMYDNHTSKITDDIVKGVK
jgi:hypothetical protein